MPSRYAQDETKVKFAVRIPKGMHDSFADRVTYLMENQAPEEHRGSVCAVLESDDVGRVLVIGTWDADAMEWWKGYALGALDALADRIMQIVSQKDAQLALTPMSKASWVTSKRNRNLGETQSGGRKRKEKN